MHGGIRGSGEGPERAEVSAYLQQMILNINVLENLSFKELLRNTESPFLPREPEGG